MPTLDYVDGLEHRNYVTTLVDRFGGGTQTGLYTTVNAPTNFSDVAGFGVGRAARATLPASTISNLKRELPAVSGHRVMSLYFRVVTAPSSTYNWLLDHEQAASGCGFRINSTGVITATNGANTQNGPNVADGNWHRLDYYQNSSANPWVLKWQVDGVAQTDVSNAQTASTAVSVFDLGSPVATQPAATFEYDHVVGSGTAGDYPIGGHRVKPLYPNGDGTHVISGAGDFDKFGGADILVSTTDAWQQVDDWITGADETSTGIIDLAGTSTEYVEHTFDDNTETTIWAVWGVYAAAPGSTTAYTITARFVQSGGTTILDIFTGDPSVAPTATNHYRAALLPAPGGTWDDTEVDGIKFRWGFSTDPAPDPQFTAVMLEEVYPFTDVFSTPLTIQDALHGHTADGLALTQHNVLAIADALHGHTVDSLVLTQHNVLAIQDALHGHAADNLALVQHHILAIADALHGHAAENVVLQLGGSVALVIQDGTHAHTADGLVLGVGLVIGDASHGHSADNLALTQHNVLAIHDALHAQNADNVVLSIPGEEPDEQPYLVRMRRRRVPGNV